jgi:hypothetical protein
MVTLDELSKKQVPKSTQCTFGVIIKKIILFPTVWFVSTMVLAFPDGKVALFANTEKKSNKD